MTYTIDEMNVANTLVDCSQGSRVDPAPMPGSPLPQHHHMSISWIINKQESSPTRNLIIAKPQLDGPSESRRPAIHASNGMVHDEDINMSDNSLPSLAAAHSDAPATSSANDPAQPTHNAALVNDAIAIDDNLVEDTPYQPRSQPPTLTWGDGRLEAIKEASNNDQLFWVRGALVDVDVPRPATYFDKGIRGSYSIVGRRIRHWKELPEKYRRAAWYKGPEPDPEPLSATSPPRHGYHIAQRLVEERKAYLENRQAALLVFKRAASSARDFADRCAERRSGKGLADFQAKLVRVLSVEKPALEAQALSTVQTVQPRAQVAAPSPAPCEARTRLQTRTLARAAPVTSQVQHPVTAPAVVQAPVPTTATRPSAWDMIQQVLRERGGQQAGAITASINRICIARGWETFMSQSIRVRLQQKKQVPGNLEMSGGARAPQYWLHGMKN